MLKKSYSELMLIDDYEERIAYLKLDGIACERNVGHTRYLLQQFYKSRRWRETRHDIIIRDNGYDVGHEDVDIPYLIMVHHINPLTLEDVLEDNPCLYDPENLICTAEDTHNYIHYGKQRYENRLITRSENDQAPWKL